MAKPVESPNYEGRNPWTAERAINGRRLAEKTAAWVEANRDDFEGIYRIVKDFQRQGKRGRLQDRVVAEALVRGVRYEADDFKMANGLWAGITRYLVLYDPTLEGNPVAAFDLPYGRRLVVGDSPGRVIV